MAPTFKSASKGAVDGITETNVAPKVNGDGRNSFTAKHVVEEIWRGLGLPIESLDSLDLPGDDGKPRLPSSYKIGILAQSSIALSGLVAAQIEVLRTGSSVPPHVQVPAEHATVEFKSERLYILDGKPTPSSWGPIGGLHKTSDGHVRVHDSFPNHRNGMLQLMGLPLDANRDQLSQNIASWAAIDLENVALDSKLAAYALRSYQQWDSLPQSKSLSDFPISLKQLTQGEIKGLPDRLLTARGSGCLRGLRVLDMSRVIAAPLCGKTLAAHGADVIWITSPSLPDLPTIDRDLGRGKRTVQLDIQRPEDKECLVQLIKNCDVFLQGFRPGSLASYGLSPEQLLKINPNLIFANMSAFGPEGPWSGRRGYDSLVQTCSGMNISEAEHAGKGEAARPTPCQALDHAGGYFLATGVIAALYRQAIEGGSWRVDASLAGTMKYLRSLGQYPGATGFEVKDFVKPDDVPQDYYETKDTGFGAMQAIRHSTTVKGHQVGWDVMPKPLGSDKAEWL